MYGPIGMVTPVRSDRSGTGALPSTTSRIPQRSANAHAHGTVLAPPSTVKQRAKSAGRNAGSTIATSLQHRRRSESIGVCGTGVGVGAVPRASSVYGRVAAGFRDGRPIGDKNYHRTMAGKLIKHLSDNKFCGQLTERQLMTMTKADFAAIFRFIFSRLVPNYECTGRLEENIPQLFRALGYPVVIKSSTLQTVSAPSSSPHVLAALTWLVDLIDILDQTDMDAVLLQHAANDPIASTLASDNADGNAAKENATCEKESRLCLYVESYLATVSSAQRRADAEAMRQLEEAYKQRLRHIDAALFQSPTEQRAHLQRKHKELDALRKSSTVDHRLDALREKLSEQHRDAIETKAFIQHIADRNGDSERVLANAAAAFEQKKCAIANAECELVSKRSAIVSQSMSGDEARSLRQRTDLARQRLNDRHTLLDETKRRKFTLEKDIARLAAELESMWSVFRKDARELLFRMGDSGKRYDDAIDWSMSPHCTGFVHYLTDTILPGVEQLCDSERERGQRYACDVVEQAERHDALRTDMDTVQHDIHMCSTHMAQIKLRKKDKLALESELQHERDSVAELQRRLEQQRMDAARHAGLGKEVEQIEALGALYKSEAATMNDDLKERSGELVKVLRERERLMHKHQEMYDSLLAKLQQAVRVKRDAEHKLANLLQLD